MCGPARGPPGAEGCHGRYYLWPVLSIKFLREMLNSCENRLKGARRLIAASPSRSSMGSAWVSTRRSPCSNGAWRSARVPTSRLYSPLTASILGAAYAQAGRAAEALPILDQTLKRIASGSRMICHALVLTDLSEALLLVGRVEKISCPYQTRSPRFPMAYTVNPGAHPPAIRVSV